MGQFRLAFNVLIILAFFSPLFLNIAHAENIAKGTIAVDGSEVKINHAYATPLFDDIIIVLTDNEVPKDMVPDGIMGLSEQGKIKGIMFSVSAESNKLLGHGESIQSLHFHPIWDQLGTIGNGELTTSTSDDKQLKGKLATPSENEWGDHKFSYNIDFTVDIKRELPDVEINGVNDEPSKAFSAYYKTLMEGNSDEFKQYIASERLKEMEKDKEMLTLFIEMQQVMSPTVVNIIDSKIEGNEAVIKVEGTKGNDKANGTIKMLNEGGKWKVYEESWVSGEAN
ncbi:MAG: hypothetical protein ACR2NW_04890 [Thermodesulfobacteriota bacterium]